jgi:hypothetical protein
MPVITVKKPDPEDQALISPQMGVFGRLKTHGVVENGI